jgi:uncharacterized membrane protein
MKFNAKTTGLLAAGFCSLTMMAAISRADDQPTPAEPSTPPTYQDVASIIANNCGYCHTGGVDALAGISLDSEEEVVANAAKAFAAVDAGLMPYGDSEWRTTPDGIQLLAYLKSQIPSAPEPEPETPATPNQGTAN